MKNTKHTKGHKFNKGRKTLFITAETVLFVYVEVIIIITINK